MDDVRDAAATAGGGSNSSPPAHEDPYDRSHPLAPPRLSLRGAAVTALLIAAVAAIEAALAYGDSHGLNWREPTLRALGYAVARFPEGLDATLNQSVATYALVHVGGGHAAINLLILLFVGPTVERWIGAWRTLLLFFAAAVGGAAYVSGAIALAVAVGAPEPAVGEGVQLIGASGGALGLIAAELVRRTRRLEDENVFRRLTPSAFLRVMALSIIGFELFASAVAVTYSGGAHLGGFLTGLALIWLFAPAYRTPAA